MITQSRLRELFDYQDGYLIWKITKGANAEIGKKAGTLNSKRYCSVMIDGKSYLLHRLIFLWHTGFLPKEIDHVDNNKKNNKIENLRQTTRKQNIANRPKQINNTSGFKGVSFRKNSNRYTAKIVVNQQQIHLGYFDDAHSAAKAYDDAAKKFFGEFAKTNF